MYNISMRKVFFSFEYSDDIWRAMNVRNSGALVSVEEAGFVLGGDGAEGYWLDFLRIFVS